MDVRTESIAKMLRNRFDVLEDNAEKTEKRLDAVEAIEREAKQKADDVASRLQAKETSDQNFIWFIVAIVCVFFIFRGTSQLMSYCSDQQK